MGICVTWTHVRGLAFSGGRGRTWGKIERFGCGLNLRKYGYRSGAALDGSCMLWRTSGSVLGQNDIVVGASINLTNSGRVVGMVALGTARR